MKQKLEATPLHRYTSRIVNSPKPKHSSNSGLVWSPLFFFVFASASSIDGAHGADFEDSLLTPAKRERPLTPKDHLNGTGVKTSAMRAWTSMEAV